MNFRLLKTIYVHLLVCYLNMNYTSDPSTFYKLSTQCKQKSCFWVVYDLKPWPNSAVIQEGFISGEFATKTVH